MTDNDIHGSRESVPPVAEGPAPRDETPEHPTPDLLAPLSPDSESDWVVLQTRARCEKKLAAWCRVHNLTIYLPLRTRVHHYGARERSFSSPLFAGYLFALTDPDARRLLLQQREVARVLRPAEPGRLLHQLRQVRDALESVDLPEVLPFIREGQPVRVNAGKLRGLEGVVERWEGKTRVFLNVEMIGQSVALEVDPRHLDPVE